MNNDRLRQYALLWLLGLYLRLAVMIVPPLLLRLEEAFGWTTAQGALAVSLPSLLIGASALIGAWLISRFGVIATIAWGIGIMAVGSALRSLPVGFAPFLLATVVMGFGIALMQIGMPVLAKLWSPTRIGRASAIYANGLLVGEILATALTGPVLARLLGEQWLWAFAVWMLPVPLIIWALLREKRPALPPPEPAALTVAQVSWRTPLLWQIAILLAAAGSLFYAGNIFLPRILAESGRAHLLDTGLTVMNGIQLIPSIALMIYADRLLGKIWPLLVTLALGLLSIPALLWLPGFGVIWAAALLGISVSALFILAMTLPAWLMPLHQVAQMAAGVTVVGNVSTFLLPTASGLISDSSGSSAAGFLPIVLFVLLGLCLTGCMR
jgi:CP family cyanate transporter-like MFS transporter